MENEFEQTVDLKKKLERQSGPERKEESAAKDEAAARKKKKKRANSRARAIDQVFRDEPEPVTRAGIRPIEQARVYKVSEQWYRRTIMGLGLLLVFLLAYFLWLAPLAREEAPREARWYMVKLTNDETYYGLISDTTADPVVIENVYYNYDQINTQLGEDSGAEEPAQSGSLRLVKRGRETHGPDGTLSVVRSQVVFMEPMDEDSKVLQAILEYEE